MKQYFTLHFEIGDSEMIKRRKFTPTPHTHIKLKYATKF